MLPKRSFAAALFLAVIGSLVAVSSAAAQTKDFFFKDGDKIVVMGDSITEQLLYSNYLEMWTVSRFPKWKLTFRNVGIGGDRSTGGNSRFKRDVLAHGATALTVDFGMNDGSYTTFKEPIFNTYMKGLQGIADQAKAAKIRVAYVTPQPIERREPGQQLEGYNQTLEKFSEGVKQIAEKNDGLFVDQFHPYLAVMNKARETDPKIIVTGGDAVHPGPAGQSLMAASILKGMSFPKLVSRVVIDFKELKVTESANCAVKLPAKQIENGLAFERTDFALPFFPEEAKSILKWSPILTDMNEYGLKVTGLPKGDWEVRLGRKKVAQYTAEELAAGVNLAGPALSTGAVADQVKKIWTAVKDKNRYFHDQIFRGVVLAGNKADVYAERMKKMPELDEAVRQALVLAPHQVEIVAVTK